MKRLTVLVAVVLVVLMVYARGGSAVAVSPLSNCYVDCSGFLDLLQIPDPHNCTRFYICIDGTPRGPYECDAGNDFNPDTGYCESSDPEGCHPTCGAANCPMTCDGTVLVIGSAFDCNIFYYCTPNGPSEVQHCLDPEKPYYNGNTFLCSSDESVCCSGYCTPYCTGNSITPDPNSCTGYYFCPEEGDVDEYYHFSCPVGDVFSLGHGDCVTDTGEPCITLCNAVDGNGGRRISTSTTTSTTTSGGGGGGDSADITFCVMSLVCTAAGNFPACTTCQPNYFICNAAGATGVPASCDDGYVFNTNPEYPNCVLSTNCPCP